MARDTFINGTETPKGKRTVCRTIRGSLQGYIGRTKWEDINGRGVEPFSDQEKKAAAAWLEGREDWYDAAWED